MSEKFLFHTVFVGILQNPKSLSLWEQNIVCGKENNQSLFYAKTPDSRKQVVIQSFLGRGYHVVPAKIPNVPYYTKRCFIISYCKGRGKGPPHSVALSIISWWCHSWRWTKLVPKEVLQLKFFIYTITTLKHFFSPHLNYLNIFSTVILTLLHI